MKLAWMTYHGQLTETIEVVASVSAAVDMLIWIVIGVVSIVSVIWINGFMKTLPRNERISVKALLIHAGAFGLFLVSVLIFTIAWTFYIFYPDSQTASTCAAIANLLFVVLGFISQCFICYVFWKLGEKIERTQLIKKRCSVQIEDDYLEIQEAPFDEDAAIQGMIWN
jgi:hypothetical protein